MKMTDDQEPSNELVPLDDTTTDLVPVDKVHGHDLIGRAPRRILPQWMETRETIVDTTVRVVTETTHAALFHAVRLPLYWLRLALRAPAGVKNIAKVIYGWAADVETYRFRSGMTSNDGKAFAEISKQHDKRTHGRWVLVLFLLIVLITALWLSFTVVAWPIKTAAIVTLLGFLGLAGRSPDKRITTRSVDSLEVPKFTTDLIITALGSLGISELNKALGQAVKYGGDGIGWPSPITREGKGWRADIDLPAGVTAGDVIEKRERLASGLRRPLSSVWPEGDESVHAGRLIIYVADQPMSEAKQGPWPLAKAGKVSIFEPFPIGVDPRGRTISITLMFASMIIGALPRMGKTFSLRLFLLGAALDPTVELHIYDLKGGADLLPLEPVAHRFRVGSDPEDIEYLARDLSAIRAEMVERYRTIRSLPRDICPEGKVTAALAANRTYRLWPTVIPMDECQIAFEDEIHGKQIEKDVTDIGKRGPAVGIIPIFSTQRIDAKSLPTGISANAVLRFCLKVMGQVENDMVLGTSSYKNGIRATQFGRKERGVGYLAGEGDEPTIVRNYYVDGPGAEKIVQRARAARIAAGTLTGHAAGTVDDAEPIDTSNILDHLVAVWPQGQKNAFYTEITQWLQVGAQASLYAQADSIAVGRLLRKHGVAGQDVKSRRPDGSPGVQKGAKYDDLVDAIANRLEHSATETNPWPVLSDASDSGVSEAPKEQQ